MARRARSVGPPGWVGDYVLPFVWFFVKLLVFLFMFVLFRATLPRFRYDQLMDLGWKLLIPLSLGWFLVVAAVQVGNEQDWNIPLVRRPAAPRGLGVGALLLRKAIRSAARRGGELAEEADVSDGLPRRVQGHVQEVVGYGTDTRQRITLQYPGGDDGPSRPRIHGRHVLNRYEDGMEKCIGCELCAGVCPARCIYVRGQDNDPDEPTSPGERFGFVYEINYLRCIHCDLCVEACPTEAITETKMFEFAFTNRSDAIYTKAELLVDDDGRPQQLPWEDWDGGFDRPRTRRRGCGRPLRAARREFEGIVAWAGELGYGVRPAEGGQHARGGGRPRPRPTAAGTTTTGTAVTDAHRDAHVPAGRAPSVCSAPSAWSCSATRCTTRSAWSPRCSASPCCSSPRAPTSWPPSRSSSTPAPSSCCSCS